jgi:hypothetical protein
MHHLGRGEEITMHVEVLFERRASKGPAQARVAFVMGFVLAVLLALPAAAGAQASQRSRRGPPPLRAANGKYEGTTDQGHGIEFRITGSRVRRIERLTITFVFACSDGRARQGVFERPAGQSFLTLHGDQSFSGSTTVSPTENSSVSEGTITARGQLRRRRFTSPAFVGTTREHVTLINGVTCDSHVVHFNNVHHV